MLTPPLDHVAFMLTPDLPPSTSKGRDDRPPPSGPHRPRDRHDDRRRRLVWLYVEPADACLPVVRLRSSTAGGPVRLR
jgi:hypothetical protein